MAVWGTQTLLLEATVQAVCVSVTSSVPKGWHCCVPRPCCSALGLSAGLVFLLSLLLGAVTSIGTQLATSLSPRVPMAGGI